ncbi:MAG: glycosyltransferase 87 family protein [Acidithiobacillus sp.]
MAGLAWRLGVRPYSEVHAPGLAEAGLNTKPFSTYFYTPLCGLLASPLSYIPYGVACVLWGLASWSVLLVGLWRFTGHVLPDWRTEWRLALLGATALASGVR